MSKSFKKTPLTKDIDRFMKNYANRRVRHQIKYFANGNAYRRLTFHYSIFDRHSRCTYAEYTMYKERHRKNHENDVCLDSSGIHMDVGTDMNYLDWYKTYKRK